MTDKENRAFKEAIGEAIAYYRSLPFNITDVAMGNVYKGHKIETKYGAKIKSVNSMYLRPLISYEGTEAGERRLLVKIFRPDGTLSTGPSSPQGFSYACTVYIGTGKGNQLLTSWGHEEKGHWEAGEYIIEIWYDYNCIYCQPFTIY